MDNEAPETVTAPLPGLAGRIDSAAAPLSLDDSLNLIAGLRDVAHRAQYLLSLNAGGLVPAAAETALPVQRAAVLAEETLQVTHLIEQLLMPAWQAGRRSVVVAAVGADQAGRRRVRQRQDGHQLGLYAKSTSWSGPWSYALRAGMPALVKRYGKWKRSEGGETFTVRRRKTGSCRCLAQRCVLGAPCSVLASACSGPAYQPQACSSGHYLTSVALPPARRSTEHASAR